MSSEKGNTLYPVFLKLHELHLLIVGGGATGLEKLTFLLKNSPDAKVTVVAQEVDEKVKLLIKQFEQVKLKVKKFEEKDLIGVNLLVLATNDLLLDKEIKQLASARNILTNVADQPEWCDFYLGSIVSKGDLKIAISTNGKSPTLAKRIREYLEEAIPENINELLTDLGEIRNKLTGGLNEKIRELNKITSSFNRKK
ncbi:MAG: siroheme synthase-like protein [Glaciecola sp.]|jgi:siroheme synthase-like protein